jgi:hypothetical protein
MKLILKTVLMSIALLFVITSCGTFNEGPGGPSVSLGNQVPPSRREFKLLSMDIPQSWDRSSDAEYWTTIKYEADPKPEILRACFNFGGDSQTCVDVQAKDVAYGSHPQIRVPILVPAGTKKIDCYVEYTRGEKTHRTNTIIYHIVALKKPGE